MEENRKLEKEDNGSGTGVCCLKRHTETMNPTQGFLCFITSKISFNNPGEEAAFLPLAEPV